MSRMLLIGIGLLAIWNSCADEANTEEQATMKKYTVRQVDRAVELTGNGADALWQDAVPLTDFTFPWRAEAAPATEFRALHDGNWLYFRYRATDPDIIVKQAGLGEREIAQSDRIEIFFKADDVMNPYYALEMDALGRVLDTECRYYRDIDLDWAWPDGELRVLASTDEHGYWVEGAISLASLRQLGMYQDDNILRAGLYRGEYQTLENGTTVTRWISWVDPGSAEPDFHIPSSFGLLLLEE